VGSVSRKLFKLELIGKSFQFPIAVFQVIYKLPFQVASIFVPFKSHSFET